MSGRRCNGEGSVYRRKDGRWAGTITLDDGTRRTFYARTQAEALDRMSEARQRAKEGRPLPRQTETVAAYLERWLEQMARPTVRITTHEGYERMVRLHVVPELGRRRIARLTADDLSRLYARLRAKGLAPKTIRLVHAMMHRALHKAVQTGALAANVADAVDAPAIERKEFKALSPDEARRLLTAAAGDPLEALYVLALTCGMRQGELLGLRWRDIDLDGAVLAVRQQAQRVKGQWTFPEPKTAKSRRTIHLSTMAVDALRRHRIRQAQDRLQAPSWEDLDLVFANRVGRPYQKQNIMRRSFWPLLDRAGLPRIRFHDLRHSCASLLLAGGEHPKVVQERLGHATIAVTMDIYSHVMPNMQKDAAERLDRLLASG
jgi:integrase